jgi:phosphatidylglycerophosphate synthase
VIGAKLGHFLDRPLYPLAKRINVSPNTLTISGFIITTLAAIVIAKNLRLGGILILIGGLLDMFDGIVARTNGKVTEFGAFLDSVLDRFSDAFVFLGLAWYLEANNEHIGVFLALGTMLGAFLISYIRARAEGLGKECKTGLMERPERIVVLTLGAISGWIMPTLWLMFFLTYLTVFQRIYHVWKSMKQG